MVLRDRQRVTEQSVDDGDLLLRRSAAAAAGLRRDLADDDLVRPARPRDRHRPRDRDLPRRRLLLRAAERRVLLLTAIAGHSGQPAALI